ncbi:thiolase [Aspergillus flavus]|nr:thiolase [Aspergillus flavus]
MVPVIIGVADIKNKTTKAEDANEPLQLMVDAIETAIQDTQLSNTEILKLKSSIDSLSVPAKLLDEESLRVASGQSRVSVITGGEALASLGAYAKIGQMPPPGWTPPETEVKGVFSPSPDRFKKDDLNGIHSIGLPIQVYPMYENGFRAHRGQSLAENHIESASLYLRFSQVAVTKPYSWNFQSKVETPESIAQVTAKNRMICLPCGFRQAPLNPEVREKLKLAIDPLLMNACNSVNLAAACIVTTAEYAAELRVPRSKLIYPLGGAGVTDSEEVWNRPDYFSSSAISQSLDGCFSIVRSH